MTIGMLAAFIHARRRVWPQWFSTHRLNMPVVRPEKEVMDMKGLRAVLLMAAAIGAVIFTSTTLWSQPPPVMPPVFVPQVTTRVVTIGDTADNEVLVGDVVVLRIRQPAGGYTAAERASVVAGRLATLLGEGYTWDDIVVGQVNNEIALLMGGNLLVTVDSAHARLNNSSPLALAYIWQNNTQAALRHIAPNIVVGASRAAGMSLVANTIAEVWPEWHDTNTRIVPIIAVGTPGVSLGAAQVTGPANRVNQVDAVLQLDATFRNTARIYAFIPSASLTSVDRVQGVAVTALLNYNLIRL